MIPPDRASLKELSLFEREQKLLYYKSCISKGVWPHLEICLFEGRGRGLVATKSFEIDEVVCHYHGVLHEGQEARAFLKREYAAFNTHYVFEIPSFEGKYYVIDATAEDESQGRLVNHGRQHANLKPKPMMIEGQMYLMFLASEKLLKGKELLYCYGQKSLRNNNVFPWLNECPCIICVPEPCPSQ